MITKKCLGEPIIGLNTLRRTRGKPDPGGGRFSGVCRDLQSRRDILRHPMPMASWRQMRVLPILETLLIDSLVAVSLCVLFFVE